MTPPPNWAEPYRRLASEVAVAPELDKAFAAAVEFLDPILAGHTDGELHPQPQTWA